MNTKQYHFQMAVKSVEDDEKGGVVIEGLASTPDIDRYRDIVEPTAFKSALEMYMKNPTVLRSHDSDRPIGTVTSATVTSKGLKIKATINDEQTSAEIKDGRMRAMSIGYIPLFTTLQHENGDEFNAETDSPWDADMVRVIKELDLVEISVVSTPANGNALFTIAKSIKAAMSDMVRASFNINSKDMDISTKDQETTPENEAEKNEDVEAGTEKAEETPTDAPEEKPAEGDDEKSKDADEVTTPDAEEAEKTGETPVADDAEGEEKAEDAEADTEEADADAKPEDGEDDADESTDDEKKAVKTILLVEEKDLSAMTMLESVGAVRAISGDEKAHDLSPEAKSLLELADSALVAAAKAIKDVEAKLDKFANKKALANHSQNDAIGGGEEKDVKKSKTDQVSKGFAMLFGQNND